MKNFKSWFVKKESLHAQSQRPYFKEREIWYCHFGINVGFEQDGQGEDFLRPVIIFKKFNKEIFLAIPLTRILKESKYYFNFEFRSGVKSSVILSQIRLIDAKRLSHKIGHINTKDFIELIKKLKEILP